MNQIFQLRVSTHKNLRTPTKAKHKYPLNTLGSSTTQNMSHIGKIRPRDQQSEQLNSDHASNGTSPKKLDKNKKSLKRSNSLLHRLGLGAKKWTQAKSLLKEQFTHDIIDPYCTVNLSSTGVTKTTKPVSNGGQNTVWTKEHNNVLTFEYSFEEEAKDVDRTHEEQRIYDQDKGAIYFDVFDQDLIIDAHIGGNHVQLSSLMKMLLKSTEITGQTIVREQPLEIPLYRKKDGAISGFLRALIRFDHEGKRIGYDNDGLPQMNTIFGKLTITIEAGSDLWDPNSEEEWIPTDADQTKSLSFSIAICFIYFFGGSLLFTWIEGWSFVDAMYFGAATFTTVGYGDVSPQSESGRLVACAFMIFGVTMVSVSIIHLWLAAITTIVPACGTCGKIVYDETKLLCCQKKLTRTARENKFIHEIRPETLAKRRGSIHAKWQHDEFEADSQRKKDEEDSEEDDTDDQNNTNTIEHKPRQLWQVALIAALKLVGLVGFGTLFFMIYPGENMNFVDATYMSTATVMTIGYGDESPSTQAGKVVATIWMTLSYAVLLRALQDVSKTIHHDKQHKMRTKLLNRDLSRTAMLNMDKDGDGELSRMEFLTHMIVVLKLCTPQHLTAIMQRFDEVEHCREARTLVMTQMENFRELNYQIGTRTKNEQANNWVNAKELRATEKAKLQSSTNVLQSAVQAANVLNEERKISEEMLKNVRRGTTRRVSKSLAMKRRNSIKNGEQASNSISVLNDLQRQKIYQDTNREKSVTKRVGSKPQMVKRNATLRGLVINKGPVELIVTKKVGIFGTGKPTQPVSTAKIFPTSVSKEEEHKEQTTNTQVFTDQHQQHQHQVNKMDEKKDPDSPSTSSVGSNDIAPEDRDNALSQMLAYMRRARDASRRYVEEQTIAKSKGWDHECQLAITSYRDLLESLHRQQKFAHDLLHPHDPEVLRLHEGNAPKPMRKSMHENNK